VNKFHLEEEDGGVGFRGGFFFSFFCGEREAGRLCVEENSFPSLEFWGEFLFRWGENFGFRVLCCVSLCSLFLGGGVVFFLLLFVGVLFRFFLSFFKVLGSFFFECYGFCGCWVFLIV